MLTTSQRPILLTDIHAVKPLLPRLRLCGASRGRNRNRVCSSSSVCLQCKMETLHDTQPWIPRLGDSHRDRYPSPSRTYDAEYQALRGLEALHPLDQRQSRQLVTGVHTYAIRREGSMLQVSYTTRRTSTGDIAVSSNVNCVCSRQCRTEPRWPPKRCCFCVLDPLWGALCVIRISMGSPSRTLCLHLVMLSKGNRIS